MTADSVEDLARRLKEAEKKLADLNVIREVEQKADDESTDLKTAIRKHWEQVRDPSIKTADEQTNKKEKKEEKKEKKWYDRLSLRGYAQFRFNELLHTDDGSAAPHMVGDRSVDENQTFLIRRARLIISGDVSDHLYVYLQPDFASGVPGSPDANQFAQIRDWYGDLYIDDHKEYRVRVGQSKVPYGWENMQSSSNRLPLDRSDGINSAVRNERDLGVFFYYTPQAAQDLFKYVLDEGLKGSGNYGVLGLGVYQGQGGSFAEQNDDVHAVARLALPYQFPNCQVIEFGIQGYTGQYAVLSSPIQRLGAGPALRPLGTLENGTRGILDQRAAATFIYYPQPFGFQLEWCTGRGPALNDAQSEVQARSLSGGYAMVLYRQEIERLGTLIPFGRYHHYQGGYKSERNAPYARIDEWEAGLEWQFNPQMELTTMYTITDRTNTTAFATGRSYGQYEGHLLRMQFQINY